LQNIINLSRKDFIARIWSPTSTVPALDPVKSSGINLVLYATTCGLSDCPATINRSEKIVQSDGSDGADLASISLNA
jgi:hypothetical protein